MLVRRAAHDPLGDNNSSPFIHISSRILGWSLVNNCRLASSCSKSKMGNTWWTTWTWLCQVLQGYRRHISLVLAAQIIAVIETF